MFSMKDGKVIADFGAAGTISLALDEVKVPVDALALVALQRVSRETVAGLAQDKPAEARAKLEKRWQLWREGKWEAERSRTMKLSDAEVEEIAWGIFEFAAKAAKLDPKEVQRGKALVEKGDKKALATWSNFKAKNAKAIRQRCNETLKARKEKDTLNF